MSCKLAVLRKDSGRKFRGDCVEAFDMSTYLGDAVEPVGGVYVVIEVNDCDKHHDDIIKLTTQWDNLNFDRQFYLQPVSVSDEFFAELFTVGRINVPLTKLQEYIRERNA